MKKRKIIRGSKIILEDRILENKALVFSEKIEALIDDHDADDIEGEIIEHQGYIAPGFIDIHIHGALGCDVMDGNMESLKTISKTIVASGVTSYLATTMTMSQPLIEESIRKVRDYIAYQKSIENEGSGAVVLGVHLEGPFINPRYKGAQDESFIQKPNLSWIENYLDVIKMITYAPEMDEDFKFTRSLRDKNIILSIGHSGCDFERALDAYEEGVDHITHCFNAVSGLHHRKPGVVGAALSKPFTLDIITDGIHIHPGFIETFVRMKSIEKTILITDSMRANFLEDGVYDLGGQRVIVNNGACRLEDGTLAGSILRMDQALKNMLQFTEFPLEKIVQMLSVNPAKKLGIYDIKGSIAKDKDSDIVLLDEKHIVKRVFIKGRLEYSGGDYEHISR